MWIQNDTSITDVDIGRRAIEKQEERFLVTIRFLRNASPPLSFTGSLFRSGNWGTEFP